MGGLELGETKRVRMAYYDEWVSCKGQPAGACRVMTVTTPGIVSTGCERKLDHSIPLPTTAVTTANVRANITYEWSE